MKRILDAVREASGGTQEGAALGSESVLESSCYLPTTADGLPVMGELPKKSVGGEKCYVAAGHSCWGILLGPATGESMAHLWCSNFISLFFLYLDGQSRLAFL